MLSTSALVALLIILIVVYIFYSKHEKEPIEYLVEDYRPKVYLLANSCEDCNQLISKFMYTIARSDNYIAIIPSTDKEYELRQKYKLRVDENPVLIVERHRKPGEVVKGNLSITIILDDMDSTI